MGAWARAGVGAGVGAEAVRRPQAEAVAAKSVQVLPYITAQSTQSTWERVGGITGGIIPSNGTIRPTVIDKS